MEHIALLLRQARENQGLSLKEAARRSRIPLSYLEMLEEHTPPGKEATRTLPDPVYLVPHLRDYAAFLGLDPAEIVAQLTDEFQKAPEINLDLTDSPQTPPLRTPSKRSRTLSASITLAVVLVILAFIGQYSDMDERIPGLSDLQTEPTPNTVSEAAPQPVPPSPPAVPVTPESVPHATALPATTVTQPSGTEPPAAAIPQPPASPTTSPAASQPRPANAPHLLRAQAQESTWIRVIIAGQAPSDMILKPGESASWTSESTFLVTLGNAGGVTFTLDGQTLPPLGTTGQFLENIRLPYTARENQG